MNGLLLDTHILLWCASADAILPLALREQIDGSIAPTYLSWVSGWEVAIKHGMGKLDLPRPISELLALPEHGIHWLPFEAGDAVAYSQLGFPVANHRDPFDRMLAVHAEMNQLVLVTVDRMFGSYLPPQLLRVVSI